MYISVFNRHFVFSLRHSNWRLDSTRKEIKQCRDIWSICWTCVTRVLHTRWRESVRTLDTFTRRVVGTAGCQQWIGGQCTAVHRWPQSTLVSASAKRPWKHADNPEGGRSRRCVGQSTSRFCPFDSVSLRSRCSHVRKIGRVIVLSDRCCFSISPLSTPERYTTSLRKGK